MTRFLAPFLIASIVICIKITMSCKHLVLQNTLKKRHLFLVGTFTRYICGDNMATLARSVKLSRTQYRPDWSTDAGYSDVCLQRGTGTKKKRPPNITVINWYSLQCDFQVRIICINLFVNSTNKMDIYPPPLEKYRYMVRWEVLKERICTEFIADWSERCKLQVIIPTNVNVYYVLL